MVALSTVTLRKSHIRQRANARRMRHIQTDAEKKFWWAVRSRRLDGFKFKRQYLIGRYIADFVCIREGLIIEIDGGQHATQQEYDRKREAFLQSKGFRVMRFWNSQVLTNIDGVIEGVLIALRSPSPSP